MLYRTAYCVSLKGLIQLACLSRDHSFVMIHIEDLFNATKPVRSIIMPFFERRIELDGHGIEYARAVSVGKPEVVALTLYSPEAVSLYLPRKV
jgi:hypothetical protein